MALQRERKPKKKVILVSGLIVKGYFPKGEEWIFIPEDESQVILHSRFLEGVVKNLRKQSEGGVLRLVFNHTPTYPIIVDSFEVKVRKLYEDEILIFSQVSDKVKRKSVRKTPRLVPLTEVPFLHSTFGCTRFL